MEKILHGLGVSFGTAKGKVRVITSMAEAHDFQKGDILVTVMTDPSMTHIMSRAGGIICDIGGLTSHASILAREMGIPCVVNTKQGTKVLKNGMDVHLNGGTGEVHSVTSEKKDLISDFVEGLLGATAGPMDFSTLKPFSHLEFHPLFSKEFLEYLWPLVESNRVHSEVKKLRGKISPGLYSDQLFFTSIDLKTAKWAAEKRLRLVNFFIDVVTSLHHKDPFSLEGKNSALSEREVGEVVSKINFQPADREIAKELGVLYTSLYHLANGLYGDLYMGLCVQNYGGFDVSKKFGEDSELVIKNGFNLRPSKLWSDLEEIAAGEIKIYCIYKNARFKTDAFSCHSNYEGDPIEGLRYWAVEADGKQLDLAEVKRLTKNFVEQSEKRWSRLTSLDFEELKRKGLLIRAYAFKPLWDLIDGDWMPTQEMFEAVKNKPFEPRKYFDVPSENYEEYWRKILDPRLDFFPKNGI